MTDPITPEQIQEITNAFHESHLANDRWRAEHLMTLKPSDVVALLQALEERDRELAECDELLTKVNREHMKTIEDLRRRIAELEARVADERTARFDEQADAREDRILRESCDP